MFRFRLEWLLLSLVLAFFASTPALSSEPVAKSMQDVRADRTEGIEQLHWLADPQNRSPTLRALQSNLPTWQPMLTPVFNGGFDTTPHWFRLRLARHTGSGSAERYLEIPEPLLNELDVYLVNGESGAETWHQLGTSLPFSQRPLAHPHYVVPLTLSRDQPTHVYVRIRTNSSLQFEPVLWQPEAFAEASRTHALINGFYYGAMLIMVLYNLLVYFVVRDRSYLYYVLFVASYTLFLAALHGDAFQFLWPNLPGWQGMSLAFLVVLMGLPALIFTRSFLRLDRESRWAQQVIRALIGVSLLLLPLSLWLGYDTAIRLAAAHGLLIMAAILTVSVWMWLNGSRHARYFVLAWFALLLGTAALALGKWGLLPWNVVVANGAQAGALAEVVLLSFALGDRIRQERARRFAAQEQALVSARAAQSAQQAMLDSQEQANRELENRVAERTETLEETLFELEVVNRRLATLSYTDQLTGLKNRHCFVERYEEEYLRALRGGRSIALILMDIDHFKAYNDRYGHQAGDACLVAVARAMDETVARAGDTLARYGGEEFIVLLSDTDRDGACIMAERLRQVVAQVRVPVAGQDLSVTVSLGVAAVQPKSGGSADRLVSHCDQALYAAKAAGRNQVRAWPLQATDAED